MVSHKLLILDIKVIIYLSFSIISMQNAFAQKSYHVLKDTTDSNSIVNKIQNIREIEVSSKHPLSNIRTATMGLSVDVEELKMLPSLMSDSDPFKSIQYLGGISQAGEASSNIVVRGGENDQNLIQLNGCHVENPTHILGLFSVFNPDLMDQMKYLKSGIPAEYGGRLSSVIDIRNFVNIPEQLQITGNLGLIASRLTLKVPITKKVAFYAAHRMSYLGSLVIPFLVKVGIDPKLAQNNFEFSDTNFGFNYKMAHSTRMSGHFYMGNDIIKIQDNALFAVEENSSKWGNRVGNVQLNHIFSENASMTHYLNFSKFFLGSNLNWINALYKIESSLSLLQYKSDYVYVVDNHNFKGGVEMTSYAMLPASIQNVNADSTNRMGSENNSFELDLYLRDEFDYGPLLFNIGLRSNVFFKHPEQDFSITNLSEHHYFGIEPRFFLRWMLDDESSLKFSASKHLQYLNRVQLVKIGLPTEIIVSSSEKIKPSSLWHFSGGYYRTLIDRNWEISAEAYYKSFSNLLEFKGNLTDLFTVNHLENLLYKGRGYAFGSEFMIKKNGEKFSAWLNYALSWNFRQFDEINNGKPFLATNDRRHDLTLVGIYSLNKQINVSASFAFATGSRLNLPRSWFVIDDKVVLEYSKYNSFKMPDYHRLDLAMTYKLPDLKKIKSEINFSIYNVYNRANPFQVYFSTKQDKVNKYDYKIKMSYLMPILPSLSWTFRF
ncbi:TonB-dependent receptor [Paludibacter sp.]